LLHVIARVDLHRELCPSGAARAHE
jgi:hypothetical protein